MRQAKLVASVMLASAFLGGTAVGAATLGGTSASAVTQDGLECPSPFHPTVMKINGRTALVCAQRRRAKRGPTPTSTVIKPTTSPPVTQTSSSTITPPSDTAVPQPTTSSS